LVDPVNPPTLIRALRGLAVIGLFIALMNLSVIRSNRHDPTHP
jgi:hypothetical protein